jgi:hypothetical protein
MSIFFLTDSVLREVVVLELPGIRAGDQRNIEEYQKDTEDLLNEE